MFFSDKNFCIKTSPFELLQFGHPCFCDKWDDGDCSKTSCWLQIILTLVELNRQVDEGITPYEEKLKFMSLLEPWQIEAADKYFD